MLFTGDMVAHRHDGPVIPGVLNVDPPEAVDSVKRLAALDTEIACFGHGEPLTQGASVELRAAAARCDS